MRDRANVRFTPKATEVLQCRELARWANTAHDANHFRFAKCFATSRAVSVNSCAIGMSVRFFRVNMKIPFGTRAIGSSTDKTLSSERVVGAQRRIDLNAPKRGMCTQPAIRSVVNHL